MLEKRSTTSLCAIIVLLVVAGPVYAKVEYVDSTKIPLVADYCGKGVSKCEDILVITKEDPCLARMEEAMKAMEFWSVLNFEGVEQVNLNIVQKYPYETYFAVLPALPDEVIEKYPPLGFQHTLNARAGRAIVLWDSVKRECFMDPMRK